MRLLLSLIPISLWAAPIPICGIGDSIMLGENTSPQIDPLTIMVANLNTFTGATTYSAVNQAQNGAATSNWVSGSTFLNNAITACSGAQYVWVMLGTNDAAQSISQATYISHLQSMIGALESAGFNKIILNYSPYMNNFITWPDADTFLLQYQSAIATIQAGDSARVFIGDTMAYTYFMNNTNQLQGDGVHPTNTGITNLAGFWSGRFENLFLGAAGGSAYSGKITIGGPVAGN